MSKLQLLWTYSRLDCELALAHSHASNANPNTLNPGIVFTDGKRFDVSGTVSSGKQPEAAADARLSCLPGALGFFELGLDTMIPQVV